MIALVPSRIDELVAALRPNILHSTLESPRPEQPPPAPSSPAIATLVEHLGLQVAFGALRPKPQIFASVADLFGGDWTQKFRAFIATSAG